MSGAGPPSAAADGAAPVVLDLHGVPCPLSWARTPRVAESLGHHVVAVDEEAPGRQWRIRIEV